MCNRSSTKTRASGWNLHIARLVYLSQRSGAAEKGLHCIGVQLSYNSSEDSDTIVLITSSSVFSFPHASVQSFLFGSMPTLHSYSGLCSQCFVPCYPSLRPFDACASVKKPVEHSELLIHCTKNLSSTNLVHMLVLSHVLVASHASLWRYRWCFRSSWVKDTNSRIRDSCTDFRRCRISVTVTSTLWTASYVK